MSSRITVGFFSARQPFASVWSPPSPAARICLLPGAASSLAATVGEVRWGRGRVEWRGSATGVDVPASVVSSPASRSRVTATLAPVPEATIPFVEGNTGAQTPGQGAKQGSPAAGAVYTSSILTRRDSSATDRSAAKQTWCVRHESSAVMSGGSPRATRLTKSRQNPGVS